MSKGKTMRQLITMISDRRADIRRGTSRGRRALASAAAIAVLAVSANAVTRADEYKAADTASSSASSTKGPTVDLDIVNANLLSVVRVLKLQSGAQIVVVGSAKAYGPVTLTVSASLPDVLHYVAQSAGATVTRDANGVYTFRPVGLSDATDSGLAADQAAPAQQPVSSQPAIPAESMHYEKIVLQNIDPNYVLNMLNDPSGYRDSDPMDNPINHSKILDNNGPIITSGSPAFGVQNTASASNPQQPSVPMANDQYSSAANQANRSAGDRSDQANQFQPFQPGGGFNPNQQNNGGFGGGNTTNNQNGANLRPQGIDSLISNEQDNALIVRGTAEGIAELKQIISFLDRAPKQVQIKLEFITANVADADTFGINWDLIPFPSTEVGFEGPALAHQLGDTFLTYAHGNLVTQLQGLLSTSKGKVIESPLVTTTNNTPASINFSSEIPYQTTTTVAQGSGNAISGNQVNFLQLVNALTVTPRVNGDNSVSLLLRPTISIPGTVPFSGAPPQVTTQSVTTYRTVANGETMVIGGLVTKNETNNSNRVPFLGDLPVIGSLFRTRNYNVTDTELLIFVTPTVLPPIGSGFVGANSAGVVGAAGSSGPAVGVTP